MRRFLFASLALVVVFSTASAQRSVVPAIAADLPGNAAVSMPLRWSEGVMQSRIGSWLLPANFIGQTIRGIRLRRPAFVGEPAYPALTRTLTVRASFQTLRPNQLSIDLNVNRTATAPAVVFGPAPFSVAATTTHGRGGLLGAEYVVIPFSPPLLVTAGHLFLEFEVTNAPLTVSAGHWCDAVWVRNGNEVGYAVAVGDGGCSTRSTPLTLAWTDPLLGPRRGSNTTLAMAGGMPATTGSVPVLWWIGFDPQARATGPTWPGFGADFGAIVPPMAGCHLWVPPDAVLSGQTSIVGTYSFGFALPPAATTVGQKIGVQCSTLDPGRAVLPLSLTNGEILVLDSIGVADKCATVFFPGTVTVSPWPTQVGLMPVVVIEH